MGTRDPEKCEVCDSTMLIQTPIKSSQHTKNVITFGKSMITCDKCGHKKIYYYHLMRIV